MTSEYAAKIEQGELFQDWVTTQLYKCGIIALCYSSRKMQYNMGENFQGIEIKNDSKWRSTGNVYIEIAEKSKAENPTYVPSGIYRKDNSWLYVIGDKSRLFCFSKKQLQVAHKMRKFHEVQTPTSRGFLLPVEGDGGAEHFWAVKVIQGDQ